MSVAESFRDLLIASPIVSDPEKIHVSRIPAVNLSEDDEWAVVQVGGPMATGGNIKQWQQRHNLNLLYRHNSGSELYAKDDLLMALNDSCPAMLGYQVISVRISPMTELEISNERTHVGNWQIEVTIAKS